MTEFADINPEQLEANKDSDKVSRLIDEWEKKTRSADANLQIVSEDLSLITKEIVKMRNDISNKRQDQLETEQTVRKGLHTLRELKSQLSTLNRLYWRCK